MTGFFLTLLLLLVFALSDASLGPRGSKLTSLLALVSSAPILWFLARRCSWSGRRGLGLLVLAATAIVLFYVSEGALRSFALATALGSLTLAVTETHSKVRQLALALTLTALGWAVFVVARDFISLWPALNDVSIRLSVSLGNWLGDEMRYGPTYSGLWFVFSFLIAFAARAIAVRRFDARVGIPAIALLVLLAAVGLVLRSFAPTHVHGIDVRVALGWRFLQFSLMLLALALFMVAHPLVGSGAMPGSIRRRPSRWSAALLLLVGAVLLTWSTRQQAHAGRVLLDTRGSFKMEALEWGKYGANASGGASLATLPQLLETHGFAFATCDTFIAAHQLEQTDVLVIMNPTQDYSEAEHAAIWDFVARGGGLLVLGDHTNIMESMEPLNRLLEPTGIQVQFDSAIPLVDRWTWYGCMRMHPHPLTRVVHDEAEVKISVGASLAVPGDASLLFSGRDAFSDAGNWENKRGAYLGSMAYDRSETLGDLFLAAEATHGRGKVIVFGDTSAFQRVAVFNTYELVTCTMSYLAGTGSAVAPLALRVTGAVLLGLGMLLTVLWLPSSLPPLVVATALISAWLLNLESRAVVVQPQIAKQSNLAWVDVAHGNRIDLHAGVEHGIFGLTNHLWRQDFMPLAMKRFDARALQKARLFVTVAPAIPYTQSEARALRDFIEAGGLLILSIGYEEHAGAAALLREFGYDIGRTPIGAAHESRCHLEDQHVFMHESWPVLRPEDRGEVWVESWGYPLIVFEKIGNGGLLVIGDSGFLWDANLESNDQFLEPNINFMRKAIETAQLRMGQPKE